MSATLRQFCRLPSPFPTEHGTLVLLEEDGVTPDELVLRLREQRYRRPFVLDNGHQRLLLFSLDYIQSAMLVDSPDVLVLAYTREMMAFLLFHTNVRELGLIGFGGGSLVKFCHRQLPAARITAVEFDPDVIAFRDHFLVPDDDARLSVIEADGAAWLGSRREPLDVLLVDAFDVHGFSPTLSTPAFYEEAKRKLARNGVLVVNLTGESADRQRHIGLIGDAFGDNLLVVAIEDGFNHVVFAFRDAGFEPRWKWIGSQARALGTRYGLDFSAMLGRLERCRRFGRGRLDE